MNKQSIILGGGCFWCVEAVYRRLPGVISAESGYAGGHIENPTYKQICTGKTGHAEVVRVTYDTNETSLSEILDWFWKAHDPTTRNRQGADVGPQYRSSIMVSDEEQRATAERSKAAAQAQFSDPIVTEIVTADTFYPAEDYHRDFYDSNPRQGYCRMVIEPKLKKLGFDSAPL
ncbi:MAG TPA: peptide-methionine (S)-S-oxide reductase MsrA [Alkalispirochaeta sp.]|nr:peptide-methionine (S)-S-oxide reductase MsrA [Alkalispirochaeta sp.]